MKLEKVIDRYITMHEVYEGRRRSYKEIEEYLSKLFSQIIHRLRYEERMGQEEIAKKMGVSRPYLSRLESGERPVLAKHFAKMAKMLEKA